jgi:hypothetical protein
LIAIATWRAIDFVEQTADACWPNIEKHCANIPEGGGHIAQRLLTNKSTASRDCQAALQRFRVTK